MPTIREVITFFGFETDERGADQVDKRIDGMKKGIGGLGKLLGVSLGVAGAKAFFGMGQRAERAEFNLKRLAGTDFTDLRRQFSIIQGDLNNIREGAASVVTEKQFDVAAAGFIRVFGRGQAQFDAFSKIFTFAAKQAAITGQEVTAIVDQIQSGIQGGGFDALLELPGFDVFRKKLLEFQQQAIDPGEPGGRIAIQNRLNAIIGVITEATKEQNNELRDVPDNLLEVDKAAQKSKDTLEKLAGTVTELLVPAFESINLLLEKFNDNLGQFKGIDSFGGAAKKAFELFLPPKEQPKPFINPRVPIVDLTGETAGNIRNGDQIKIEMTNIIRSTEPAEVAKEVNKGFQEMLKRERQSIIKTEAQ